MNERSDDFFDQVVVMIFVYHLRVDTATDIVRIISRFFDRSTGSETEKNFSFYLHK